jgi:PAS domain S-box-containing protein
MATQTEQVIQELKQHSQLPLSREPTIESLSGWSVSDVSDDGQSSDYSSIEADEEMSGKLQLLGDELFFCIDAEGLINEWSREASAKTKFAKEDVVGQDFVDYFITPEFQKPLQKVLQKAQVGEETTDFAFPLYTLDACCVQLLLTTVTRRNEVGDIVGIHCICKDVSEPMSADF